MRESELYQRYRLGAAAVAVAAARAASVIGPGEQHMLAKNS